MATNFAHMTNYKEIYSKLLWIESQMVNGYMEAACETEEEYNMRIESCRAVSGVARTALEMMIDELFRVGQITDAKVEEILQRLSKNEQSYHANLYGKIKLMEEYELVPQGMLKDMHFVRMSGNQELHGTQAREYYISAKENAVKVYEALYRISYLFAGQYMAEFAQMGREVEVAQRNVSSMPQGYPGSAPQTYSSSMPQETSQTTTKPKKKPNTVVAAILGIVSLIAGLGVTALIIDSFGSGIFDIPSGIFMILFIVGWLFFSCIFATVLGRIFGFGESEN